MADVIRDALDEAYTSPTPETLTWLRQEHLQLYDEHEALKRENARADQRAAAVPRSLNEVRLEHVAYDLDCTPEEAFEQLLDLYDAQKEDAQDDTAQESYWAYDAGALEMLERAFREEFQKIYDAAHGNPANEYFDLEQAYVKVRMALRKAEEKIRDLEAKVQVWIAHYDYMSQKYLEAKEVYKLQNDIRYTRLFRLP